MYEKLNLESVPKPLKLPAMEFRTITYYKQINNVAGISYMRRNDAVMVRRERGDGCRHLGQIMKRWLWRPVAFDISIPSVIIHSMFSRIKDLRNVDNMFEGGRGRHVFC